MSITLEAIREHCLKKKGVTEDFPFDEDTLVFKVMNKIFLLTDVNFTQTVNLKCDPEMAVELRERYDDVTPGFHMNKKYWNTVDVTGNIPPKKLLEWIDHSYDEVVKKLKKKEQEELLNS